MPLPYITAVTKYGDNWKIVYTVVVDNDHRDFYLMRDKERIKKWRLELVEYINQKITDEQIITLSEKHFPYVENLYDDSVIDFARAIIQQTLKLISEK